MSNLYPERWKIGIKINKNTAPTFSIRVKRAKKIRTIIQEIKANKLLWNEYQKSFPTKRRAENHLKKHFSGFVYYKYFNIYDFITIL